MKNEEKLIRRTAPETYPKKKVLCLVSNPGELMGFEVGFFGEELTRPFFEFKKAGFEVDLASPKGGLVKMDVHSDLENPEGHYQDDLITLGFKYQKTY